MPTTAVKEIKGDKFLNLKVGKIYKLTNFDGITKVVKIVIATQMEGYHSYWGGCPTPGRAGMPGKYYLDAGIANQGRTIAHNSQLIRDCVEMDERDLCSKCYSDKTDTCDQGGSRCVQCGHTSEAP